VIKFKILPLVYQILFLNTVLFGNNIPCPIDNFIQKINQIQQEDFDNEFSIIEKHINEISTNLDTACIIKLYQTYVRSSGGKGNYYLVFDALWRALLLADEANLNVEKFDINITIARFYGYLERYEKAEEYFEKAYKLKDHLLLDNKIINVKVINLYSPQAKMYERMGDVELAKLYLDSCDQQIAKYKLDKNYYVEHTRALLFAKEGHLKEALSIFKEIEEKMKYLNPAYLSIVYAEIGDVYYSLNQYNVSLKAYQDAIVINDQYKKHTDYSPKIYGKLATLYNKLGNYQQAYEMSEIESDLNFELFDSRSKRSSNMLKVQDNFRIYKEDEEKRIQEYELKNLRQEKRYERVLLVGSLLFLSIIAFVYFRLQKGRIKVEKALNSQLKIQNAEKEKFLKRIEKKNEELMTFSNIMSHDLKAPIKNISAFSGLIKKQVKNEFDKKKVSTFNNYIDSSAKSMLVLIEDLLLYSRISLDEQKFSKVDLNEVINSVYPAFSYDVNNGNASVNIEKLPTICKYMVC